ncbi:sensor histidine kinase [Paenibacillus sp. GCM10023252]|uniref:sensor histidine kinase n=1 Tax=Paenibacillus sp. GCM10023252 TaxID=3252649 RepID=UPI003623F927
MRSIMQRLFYNHISIKQRLLLYFILLVLLPSTFISVTLYNKSSTTISNNMTDSIARNMNMMHMNLTQKLEEINDLMTNIYLNSKLQEIISSDKPMNDVTTITEIAELNELLRSYNLKNLSNHSMNVKLYLMNRPQYPLYNFIGNVYTMETIQNQPWYQSIPYKTQYSVLGLFPGDTGSKQEVVIRMIKRIYNLDSLTLPYAGLLTVDVDLATLYDVIIAMKPSPGSQVFLLNEENHIMVGPKDALVDTPFQSLYPDIQLHAAEKDTNDRESEFYSNQLVLNGVDTLTAIKELPALGWKIVSLSPVKDLNRNLLSFQKVMIIVLLVSLGFAILLSFVLSNNITKPLSKFVKSISAAEDDLFNVTIEYKRNDEFAYLFHRFNNMIKRIRELIDRLYVTEANKKKAELEALQAQINPHFLYNTLDSINWMALKKQAPEISQMVTSLSDFFRLSLNKGNSIITLGDELKQVEAYLTIQKIRMSSKLSYTIEADREVLPLLTVKLIVQPLVENAILHGFDQSRGRGHVAIEAFLQDNGLVLLVTDDGSGTEEDVHKINGLLDHAHDQTASFGIRNVNARIKQWFGEQYGLTYEANTRHGLTARITLPAAKTMEE